MASPSDKKEANEETVFFSATEAQLRTFLESVPDAMVIVDVAGKIVAVNQQTEQLFGYSREELLGKHVEKLIPARNRSGHESYRDHYTRTPRVRTMGVCMDLRAIRKDGTEFPVDVSLSPVETPSGLRVFSAIRDMTRKNRTEEALRHAKSELETRVQERTSQLMKAVRDLGTEIEQHQRAEKELEQERDRAQRYLDVAEVALLALDQSGKISMINRKGLRMLGYKENELLGRDWFTTCMPKRYQDRTRQVFSHILDGRLQEYIETPIITKEGEERLLAWHNTLLTDAAGSITGTLSSGEDITEQRQAEDAVKRLAAIVESSDDAIIGTTLDGSIVSWNGGAERLYGYSASEVIGQSINILIPPERPGEIDGILEIIKRGERILRMETIRADKNGRLVDVSISVWPVLDDKGNPVAVASIVRDITERQKLERQLRQAHKMEAIGRLAGGIAHDFNNLLGVILGDSELLLADRELGAAGQKAAEEIMEAGERAASLTRQLLAFSRQQTLETHIIDLNAVMAGFENILRRLAGPGIAFDMVLDPNLGAIRADPNQLLQVILNLVVNARDALPRGGKLRLEASSFAMHDTHALLAPGDLRGPHVQITVADNGPGMNRETLAHIFEPFFTTKEQGQGAGLGLATAYGIVQQLGGSISAHSEPGKGATFTILLPQVNETGSVDSDTQSSNEMPSGTETVLLVEDAGLLRRVTHEFLQRIGYTVLAAENGEKAMSISTQHRGAINLLLTDLAMPGMNGQELAARLLDQRPDLKVLYTSGYAESALSDPNSPGNNAPFIEKPFSWQELALKVRSTLDKPKTTP